MGFVGSSGVATAATEWDNYDEAKIVTSTTSTDYLQKIGAGLVLTEEFTDPDGDYVTKWELAGDGVVHDENGHFPAPDDYYDSVPDEVDTCPRDYADGKTASVYEQGFVITVDDLISVDGDFKDPDEKYMFPNNCYETTSDAATLAEIAADLAEEIHPVLDGVITGVELAENFLELTGTDSSGKTYDLRETYGKGYLRGGFGLRELIIRCDVNEEGAVDVDYAFGEASTGFEIYVSNSEFGESYSVTEK